MDADAAIKIIDEAISAIDAFDADYSKADTNSPSFQTYWDRSIEVEHSQVLPRLELTRQIAIHLGADDLPVAAPADKSMYNTHPFENNRKALVVLRTRLEQQSTMAAILGASGPQLSTASLHPTIWDAAAHLFDGGHYRQAVQTAGQALESHLQAIAGPDLTGQDLAKLFAAGGSGTRLHFAELDPAGKTYTSAREGAASLIRGAMLGVRNLVSHPEWPDPNEVEALEMLAVLSYVAHLVDRASEIE
jgi:hypothetical protein